MEISPTCNYPNVELGGDKRSFCSMQVQFRNAKKDDCKKMQKNHKSTFEAINEWQAPSMQKLSIVA
jgi:hypothetical protein